MTITPNMIIIIVIVLMVLILIVGAVLFWVVNKQNVNEHADDLVMKNLSMSVLPDKPDDIDRTARLDDFETTERIICFSESRKPITCSGRQFTIEYELSFTGSTEIIE